MRNEDSEKRAPPKSLLYPLKCPVMDYAWGQSGKAAFILKLSESTPSIFLEDPLTLSKKPAAELWMGAHPKAPAQIDTPEGTQPLDRELSANPEHYLGPQLAKKGHRRLSFLFKILDAKSPLSVQAHPDSHLAKKLHSQKPEHYPDPYHKPELAVCIKDMSALLGFRPIDEIFANINRIAALARLCKVSGHGNKTKENISKLTKTKAKAWLKKSYAALMQSAPEKLERAAQLHLLEIEQRKKDLYKMDSADQIDKADSLFVLFAKRYGLRDPGIFCAYFLNYVELKPGEALFLEPNSLHSYISGVILECMAASDNVVRAGLSPKYCDIPTLIEMLHYRTGQPQILKALKEKNNYSYAVPVKDFSLRLYMAPEFTESPEASVDFENALSYRKPDRNPKKVKGAKELEGFKEIVLRDINRPSIVFLLGEEAKAELIFYSKKEKRRVKTQSLTMGSIFFLPGDLEYRGVRLVLQISKGILYRASGPR